MLKSLRDETVDASPVEPARRASPSWLWIAAAVLVAAISLAPLLVVEAPAVLDYPNHLARFFVLAHPDDPTLARMYVPHWALLPNLGMDVLGAMLLAVVPPDVGGRILLGVSLLAPLAGAAVYARAAFGRWTWWSLGAGVIAFNGIFFLGFMNFLLALGVALAGAGAWRLSRRRRRTLTALGGALVGLATFFCHVFGFAYFAVLIAAEEGEELLKLRRERRLGWRDALSAAAMLTAALAPTLALYALTHHANGSGDAIVWRWRAKPVQCLVPFMAYDRGTTIVTAAVVGSVLILVWRRSVLARGAALALALLGGLYLAAPAAAAGGTFVDTRLPLMTVLLLFAGVAPRISGRAAVMAAAALTLVMVGRSAEVAANWQVRARDLADLRAGLAHIQPGSKILPARIDWPARGPSGGGRVLPNVAPLDDHLGALAVIERHAFWPLLFADPTQQPLIVAPSYQRAALPIGYVTAWRDLFVDPRAQPGRLAYLGDWRSRFDYVLVVGPKPAADDAPQGLTLVSSGEAVSIYRIDGGKRQPAS